MTENIFWKLPVWSLFLNELIKWALESIKLLIYLKQKKKKKSQTILGINKVQKSLKYLHGVWGR